MKKTNKMLITEQQLKALKGYKSSDFLFRGVRLEEFSAKALFGKDINTKASLLTYIKNNKKCEWYSLSRNLDVVFQKYWESGYIAICKPNDLDEYTDIGNMSLEVFIENIGDSSKLKYSTITYNYSNADSEVIARSTPKNVVFASLKEIQEYICEYCRYISGIKDYEVSSYLIDKILNRNSKSRLDVYDAVGDYFYNQSYRFDRDANNRTIKVAR